MRKTFLTLISVLLCTLLTACSGESKATDQYVNSVRTLVNDSVAAKRAIKEIESGWKCTSEESSRAYIAALDEAADIYSRIIALDPPARYDEEDQSLEHNCSEALSCVTGLRSIVDNSFRSGDDSLYLQEKDRIFEQYDEFYQQAVQLSSFIQTDWRNA